MEGIPFAIFRYRPALVVRILETGRKKPKLQEKALAVFSVLFVPVFVLGSIVSANCVL